MSSSSSKSSIIGFILIGAILLLFSWYNTEKMGKAAEEQRRIQDSIALMNSPIVENAAAEAAAQAEAAAVAQQPAEPAQTYGSASLEAAFTSETSYYTIENDKLAVTISSKGAQPYKALVKQYFAYDSSQLFLIGADRSSLGIDINTRSQWINTADLNFSPVEQGDRSLTLRLTFEEGSYIDAVYTLEEDSYMLGYTLRFVGMDNVIEPRTTHMDLKWAVDMPRLEKGYKNEKNYSAVAYRFGGEDGAVKTLGQGRDHSDESFPTRMRWIGFQQQFFSAIIVADNDFSSGKLENQFYPEGNPDRLLMHSQAEMSLDLDAHSSDYEVPMHFYFGPNHFPTMKSYGQKFERIIPLGGKVIGTISRFVIIPLFNWLSKYIASYGLIILILTLIIKTVISPLTFKSYASSAKMKVLKPEVDKIAARYPKQEDAMKKQQATMELYKKAGVSTLGGCLPILLQFPILWAMFRFFPASIELRQHRFLWADDLSGYDSILDFGFNIPLFGDHFSLFAFLMAVSMFFYSRYTMQGQDTSAMPGMKFMNVWLMPIMMWFFCNNFSAGLSYYYLLSNLVTIFQNWAIRKWFIDEDKIYAKLKEAQSKPTKKSKFQQRIDEMYKMQQQQQRQQQGKK